MKIDLIIGSGLHLIAGVSLASKEHHYVNRYDGLVIAPNGPELPHGQRLVVPREQLFSPVMQPYLEKDGLLGIAEMRLGAKIDIVQEPGAFIGFVQYYPELIVSPALEAGGICYTAVDGQRIITKSVFY
jgi:hypothetical protein